MGRDTSRNEGASRERIVADRIEAYLAEHPDAADTLAGICNWWLSGVPEFAVQQALDDLATRGMVKRQDVPGGAAVYSRGPGGASRPVRLSPERP